ncbi:lipopolysaccharide biosynthesis protein [Profundibacter sp.]
MTQTTEGAKWFWIVANAVFLSQAGALVIGGMVLSDIDIGHLRLAERLGLMAGFALTVTDPVVAQYFARDHGNRILLKRHFMLASGIATLSALTISIFIIFFNDRLLDLVGGDTEIGRALLYVYLAGSVFNAMTGTSSMLLSMTGNEKFLMRTVVLTFLLAMPSYYFGGLAGGAMGFAIAYLLILVLKNSIIFLRVLQILSGPGADMDANGKTG